jgi:cbb3-type cytochrome oxidase subunit 3
MKGKNVLKMWGIAAFPIIAIISGSWFLILLAIIYSAFMIGNKRVGEIASEALKETEEIEKSL